MSSILLNRLDFQVEKTSFLGAAKYLNLPDLQFFLWCQKKYRLNKGIFNTIDNWFYSYGILPIAYRRIYILAFLEFVKDGEMESCQHTYIRFGNGGLSKKLNQFTKEIVETNKE